MVDKNEIKKDLYKSKNFAVFSHYQSGNLYYTVEINEGKFQFPISTLDKVKLDDVVTSGIYDATNFHYKFEGKLVTKIKEPVDGMDDFEEIKFDKLSSDLGSTPFGAEVKGSELIRWIQKAIDAGEFIKVG